MDVKFDLINQACITQHGLNNAFKAVHPVVGVSVDGRSVEFTFSFQQDTKLKEKFCAGLVPYELIYSEEGNAIILDAIDNQAPKVLRSLDLVAEDMRSPKESPVSRYSPTLFSPRASHQAIMKNNSTQSLAR